MNIKMEPEYRGSGEIYFPNNQVFTVFDIISDGVFVDGIEYTWEIYDCSDGSSWADEKLPIYSSEDEVLPDEVLDMKVEYARLISGVVRIEALNCSQ